MEIDPNVMTLSELAVEESKAGHENNASPISDDDDDFVREEKSVGVAAADLEIIGDFAEQLK